MKIVVTTTPIALVLALLVPNGAQARSAYLNEFNSLYGTAGTRLDTCSTCHGATKSIRNPYGQDVEAQINAGLNIHDALITVEPLESDGDGYVNVDEILALFFPGDPNDHPGGPSCTDNDGDGYAVEGGSCGTVDCDDADPNVNPGAQESCTNGIDDDCDGLVDAQDPDAVGCPLECTDGDADTYSVEGDTCGPVDCDDGDPAVNPGAVENCANGIDDDCDGFVDGADSDCGGCVPTSDNEKGPRCKDGVDNDCDGAADGADSDCVKGGDGGGGGDKEICDDGIDNDGDGKVDCADKKDCNKDPAC